MTLVRYHDTTHSPVGLWQFNGDMNDSSGNGFNLAVEAGGARYTDIFPGVRGFAFDGSTRLFYNTSGTALAISGDVTIEMLLNLSLTTANAFLVIYGGGNDTTSDTNVLYSFRLNGSNGHGLEWVHEHGTGTNAVLTIDSTCPRRHLCHLAVTRTSNVVQFYLNGRTLGPASGTLTAADGGSTSVLHLGGESGVTYPNCNMASLKIIASALTANQIADEYNYTLGEYYGRV